MKKEGRASSAVHAAPAEKTEFSLIPPATLEALYANLLKDRMMDERVRRAKAPREAGWAAVKAAAAAVLMDTDGDDVVATSDAMPLVRLLRGEKAAAIVRGGNGVQKAARAEDAAKLLLHAVGVALASKTKKNGKVAVVLWRHAGLECWRDALEVARVHTLPMIFVCPTGGDSKTERKKENALTPGTELPRIVVDGYDAVAVYRVAHESIDRARRDRGATLIECASFRLHGRGNAVANMERYLRGKGMLRRGMKREIEEAFAAELKVKRKKRTAA